jgi:hypothetical protein
VVRQVSLSPVWTGSGSGLRKGVEALPPSVTSLTLLPDLGAVEREGGFSGGAWRLRLASAGRRPFYDDRRSVPDVLELCAAFDRPGLPCGLEGRVGLLIKPPAVEAGPQALGAYVGQCAELAGRLRSGGTPSGVELDLEDGGGGGAALDHVLGAMLPAAAPHVRSLHLLASAPLPPGFSRHLAPGLAFPLLSSLWLCSDELDRGTHSIQAVDVAALARLVAPRLCHVGLLCPTSVGGSSTAAVRALAMGLARPVDAEGRLAGLQLFVGVHPSEEGDEQGLGLAIEGAGRGWVRVVWLEPEPVNYDEFGPSNLSWLLPWQRHARAGST